MCSTQGMCELRAGSTDGLLTPTVPLQRAGMSQKGRTRGFGLPATVSPGDTSRLPSAVLACLHLFRIAWGRARASESITDSSGPSNSSDEHRRLRLTAVASLLAESRYTSLRIKSGEAHEGN